MASNHPMVAGTRRAALGAGNDHPQEHGFWDYTTPAAGGMEHYQFDDYRRLLDDMQSAGMNSLAIAIKWTTTGYRSRLPFLDQHAGNPVTDSDNELLHQVFDEAARRRIHVWLAAVTSMFPADKMKSPATAIGYWDHLPGFQYGIYDLDCREVTDRAVAVFEEIASLFPKARGLVVEIEASGKAMPHRIPLYNRWAKANDQPRFDKLGLLETRVPPVGPWRDYTTHRRIELSRRIEKAVRAQGYRGQLMMLCETGWQPGVVTQEVNLSAFARHCSRWSVLSYETAYNKTRNRHGMMEMAITEPHDAGLKTFYLPRGVMTWVSGCDQWPLPVTLRQSWRMDLEDMAQYRPEGVWWFGSGGIKAGIHLDPADLKKAGYRSARAARKALLREINRFQSQRTTH